MTCEHDWKTMSLPPLGDCPICEERSRTRQDLIEEIMSVLWKWESKVAYGEEFYHMIEEVKELTSKKETMTKIEEILKKFMISCPTCYYVFSRPDYQCHNYDECEHISNKELITVTLIGHKCKAGKHDRCRWSGCGCDCHKKKETG